MRRAVRAPPSPTTARSPARRRGLVGGRWVAAMRVAAWWVVLAAPLLVSPRKQHQQAQHSGNSLLYRPRGGGARSVNASLKAFVLRPPEPPGCAGPGAWRSCEFHNKARQCGSGIKNAGRADPSTTGWRRPALQGNCPRIFIYDLREPLYDLPWRPSKQYSCERPVSFSSEDIIDQIFGTDGIVKAKACHLIDPGEWESVYASQQWRGAEMLLYRAATSLRCPRTFDPHEADLFLVPVLPAAKSGSEWNGACADADASEPELLKQLPYLNATNAHRHLMVLGKGIANAKLCGWFMEPTSLLRRAQRFAYSAKVMLPKVDYDVTRSKPRYGPVTLPYIPRSAMHHQTTLPPGHDLRADLISSPNLVSIPYPSSIHASMETVRDVSMMPWRVRPPGHREILMSFQGKLAREELAHAGDTNGTWIEDKHYGARVRQRIDEICRHLPPHICHVDRLEGIDEAFEKRPRHAEDCFLGIGRRTFHPESLELVKGHSTFCLEPLGDSPYRKSFWDSLSLGCIPVVFSLYSEITAPWHWGSWRNQSRVYIPEEEFLANSFDLVHYLQSIPNSTVQQMQLAIAENAHRIQFAVDDLPFDTFEVLMRRAAHEASKFEHARWVEPYAGETGQWLDVGVT